MTERGEFTRDDLYPPLEVMKTSLFEHGWSHSDDWFRRAYARVNPALEEGAWEEAVSGVFDLIRDAPDLRPGITIRTARRETEVEISLHGELGSTDDVRKAYLIDEYLRASGFEDIDEAMLETWLILKGEPGAPRIGSREFYEQHPRAAELRRIGLEAIPLYLRVAGSEGIEGQSMERLIEINTQLAELGVEPAMHTGAPKVTFVDPVVRAEWVTGTIRECLQHGYGFSGSALALLQEYTILGGHPELAKVVESDSPAVKDAMTLMNLISLLKHLDPDNVEEV